MRDHQRENRYMGDPEMARLSAGCDPETEIERLVRERDEARAQAFWLKVAGGVYYESEQTKLGGKAV